MGFLSFFTNIFGESSNDAFTAYATGSVANQVVGSILLCMSLFMLFQLRIVNLANFFRSFYLWGILIAWFMSSIIWSYEPAVSFRRVIAFTTLVLVVYCLVQNFSPKSLLRIFVITVFITASIGLVEAVVSPKNAFINGGIRSGAFTGFYFDKNGGARVYAYALLTIVGLGFYKERWGLFAFFVIALCLTMSRSATALVMVIGGGGLIFMFKSLRAKTPSINISRLALLILVLLAGGYLVFLLYETLLELLGRDSNLTNRTIIWELLAPFIAEEFTFGYGFGAFWASDAVSSFLERWGFIGNAHSGYLEAMLQGGIVCIAILSAILFNMIYLLFKSYVHDNSGELSTTLIPLVIIQIIVNFIGFIILNHNSVDMFIFLLAFFVANYKQSRVAISNQSAV